MQVGYPHHLRGRFAEPSAQLVDAGVYLDEVNARQVDTVAVAVNGPVDVEIRLVLGVQAVVGVAQS